ncbi:SET domain-containing protein SmydA-8 [Bombyx mori]|uniref:Protein msta n=1 Tax=Bombyx mori TaxID=7091 RepID=A0A8R2GCG9_BOMMO|nr:SET domain-containing protein SmydA-8 [Bombyx mori]
MTNKYEVRHSEQLGRYLIAAKALKAGETILSDAPFVVGPNADTSLVCFDCYCPLISKFNVCKNCALVPICPGDGCPEAFSKKWHNSFECEQLKRLKLTAGLNPMTMVRNVGSLLVLRTILKRNVEHEAWNEFMQLETHLEARRGTDLWDFYENTVKFIQSLGLLECENDKNLVQKICAAIDVNSFEVRGPSVPGIGCGETLRGVYLQAALLAHDCVGNTHMSIGDDNLLVCHASVDINIGDIIYYNYTDALKGTDVRQQHLLIGKYFKCTCSRCMDITEVGTYMSSAMCPECKFGYVSRTSLQEWTCKDCGKEFKHSDVERKVACCTAKLQTINKNDERELEEYIRNVSLVLAPNHYLLLDAKQRLAGLLRDIINREPRPTKKLIRRKLGLCEEMLPVLEKLCPGISRIKAIPLYEMHAAIVQLATRMFHSREINGSEYLEELLKAELYLKKSLEMLIIEPVKSPEGKLCAKALEDYRTLKAAKTKVLGALHVEGKSYDTMSEKDVSALNRT